MILRIKNEMTQFGLSKWGTEDYKFTILVESEKSGDDIMKIDIILDEGEFNQLKELVEIF